MEHPVAAVLERGAHAVEGVDRVRDQHKSKGMGKMLELYIH